MSGLFRIAQVTADPFTSFKNEGTGILRYDNSGLTLNQGVLDVSHDVSKDWSINAVFNYYPDGDQHLGLSQATLTYKPLTSSTLKWKLKAGFFFPEISVENLDKGWQSPFTYTYSAINSWLGEELRTPGIEVSLFSPGRQRNSPWSWQLNAGAYQGNDTIGSLLAWRGWSFNDRQSLNNDRISFAPIPTVISQDFIDSPNYAEPFHEIDGRVGIYLGSQLEYYKRTTFKYYYYDNLANPKQINSQRLYAWHTKFHSFGFQHKLNGQTRLLGQYMSGSTEMGLNFVNADFDAWFVMLSHRQGKHRLSGRYDKFKVRDAGDIFPEDINDSDGYGFTLAWRYMFNTHWEVGIEHHTNENRAQNRITVNQSVEADQQQTLLVAQFRW